MGPKRIDVFVFSMSCNRPKMNNLRGNVKFALLTTITRATVRWMWRRTSCRFYTTTDRKETYVPSLHSWFVEPICHGLSFLKFKMYKLLRICCDAYRWLTISLCVVQSVIKSAGFWNSTCTLYIGHIRVARAISTCYQANCLGYSCYTKSYFRKYVIERSNMLIR